jgi:hypothetical protein
MMLTKALLAALQLLPVVAAQVYGSLQPHVRTDNGSYGPMMEEVHYCVFTLQIDVEPFRLTYD